jgi:hypothetical protein
MKKLGALFVKAGNQERHAERPAHDLGLAVGAFAETQGQVADGLGARLDAQGLGVVEGVGLAFDAGVLNHGPRVGLEPAHGAANMAVNLDNLLDRRRFEQRRGYALLDTQDDALRGGDADGGGAELDCLKGVFDLEETPFRGEGAVGRGLLAG